MYSSPCRGRALHTEKKRWCGERRFHLAVNKRVAAAGRRQRRPPPHPTQLTPRPRRPPPPSSRDVDVVRQVTCQGEADRAESFRFRPPELLPRGLLVVASRPAVPWRRRSLDRVYSVLGSISEQAEGKKGRIGRIFCF